MNIMWFCIPAFGHTNPTIEVVRELTRRGHLVRYYSFSDFREKIEEAGATFISCDAYLPALSKESERRLREVSTTEMSVKAFETTAMMDGVLAEDVAKCRPSVIVSDSVCFWGKLTAEKYGIPMVCSTTTFAFNQHSAKYLKNSPRELADMILGIPRLNRAIRQLEPLGYHVKSALDIVQNKPETNTIVYTSKRFQPCAETFDPAHYCFVGPSVKRVAPAAKTGNPLVYISLGTVIENHPEFYRNCLDALAGEKLEVLISCGRTFDRAALGKLPENARVEPYVNQMEVLAKASLFITHCGMNSASEGMYMGVPELLLPLTGEQQAVAQRVTEMGAGRRIQKSTAKDPEKLREAILDALNSKELQHAALQMRKDFLACPGPSGAADFIEKIAGK